MKFLSLLLILFTFQNVQADSCTRLFHRGFYVSNIRQYHEIKKLKKMTFNVSLDTRFNRGHTEEEFRARLDGRMRRVQSILLEESPDLVVLQEVGEIARFDRMLKGPLKGIYKPIILENTKSEILDTVFLVKEDLPFDVTLESHQHVTWRDPTQGTQRLLFPKGLPTLVLRKHPNDPPFLILIGNHAKSKRGRSGDPESFLWRFQQYRQIAKIIQSYEARYPGTAVIIGGDFNTSIGSSPELSPLKYFLRSSFELAKKKFKGILVTHTYHPAYKDTIYQHLDDFMLSAGLWNHVIEAKVYRHKDKDGNILPIPKNQAERDKQSFDHFPVLLTLSTEALF